MSDSRSKKQLKKEANLLKRQQLLEKENQRKQLEEETAEKLLRSIEQLESPKKELGMALLQLKNGLEVTRAEQAYNKELYKNAPPSHLFFQRDEILTPLLISVNASLKLILSSAIAEDELISQLQETQKLEQEFEKYFTATQLPLYINKFKNVFLQHESFLTQNNQRIPSLKEILAKYNQISVIKLLADLEELKKIIRTLPFTKPSEDKEFHFNNATNKLIDNLKKLLIDDIEIIQKNPTAVPTFRDSQSPVVKSKCNQIYSRIYIYEKNIRAISPNTTLFNEAYLGIQPFISKSLSLKLDFISDLYNYIGERRREAESKHISSDKLDFYKSYNHFLGGFFGGFSAGVKISAAKKLLYLLTLDQNDPARESISFTDIEMEALHDARLRKITDRYERLLPKEFTAQDNIRILRHHRLGF